jgi:predicted RNase H-like HicB family nuclease
LLIHSGKGYTFKVHEGEHGYWARCDEVPAAITQAPTLDKLAENMKEALALALKPVPPKVKKKVESKKP